MLLENNLYIVGISLHLTWCWFWDMATLSVKVLLCVQRRRKPARQRSYWERRVIIYLHHFKGPCPAPWIMTEVLRREDRTIGPTDQGQWILNLLEKQYGSFLSFLTALPHSISARRKSMGAMPLCHLYLSGKGLISINPFFQEMLEKVDMITEIASSQHRLQKDFLWQLNSL